MGVSTAFEAGKITAIIGPNGAGKTSLVRALVGLITPVSGSVTLDGIALAEIPSAERARRIGYLPQNAEPSWAVTVEELVALGRLPHRSPFAASTAADQSAVEAALAATDTTHLANRTVDSLSGGECARAKMARVLAGEPDWIIVDEPLANLDPPHQRDLLVLLRTAADRGAGLIVVLHQLNAALRVADDVIILRDGAPLAHGAKYDALTPENLALAFGMDFELVETPSGRAIID